MAELAEYKIKLKSLRGLPAAAIGVLELAAGPRPIRWMCFAPTWPARGCILPEKDEHTITEARDLADMLLASLGSALLYWHQLLQEWQTHQRGD